MLTCPCATTGWNTPSIQTVVVSDDLVGLEPVAGARDLPVRTQAQRAPSYARRASRPGEERQQRAVGARSTSRHSPGYSARSRTVRRIALEQRRGRERGRDRRGSVRRASRREVQTPSPRAAPAPSRRKAAIASASHRGGMVLRPREESSARPMRPVRARTSSLLGRPSRAHAAGASRAGRPQVPWAARRRIVLKTVQLARVRSRTRRCVEASRTAPTGSVAAIAGSPPHRDRQPRSDCAAAGVSTGT